MKYILVICMFLTSVTAANARSIVLGDSLSDPGNAAANDEDFPIIVYPNGQFTNGDVWATQVGSGFNSGLNFAFGGATALPSLGTGVPDLADQVDSFLGSDADTPGDANVAIWIGGNDLLGALEGAGLISGVRDPKNIGVTSGSAIADLDGLSSTLFETADNVVRIISEQVERLDSQTNVDPRFILFGLPELGKTPLVRELGPGIAALMNQVTRYFNEELRLSAEALGTIEKIPTTFFDVNAEFEEILADPSAFGIDNTTEACIVVAPVGCLEGNPDPNTFAFYDPIHPSERVHSVLAEEYESLVVPVPASLPLLFGGILLLSLTRLGSRKKAG